MSDPSGEIRPERVNPNLERLREAVILASDPRPGRRIDAIVVCSVWVLDTNPSDAVFDLIGTPPEQIPQVLRALRTMFGDLAEGDG